MNTALAKLIDLRAVEPIDPQLVNAVTHSTATPAPDITNQADYDANVKYVRELKTLETSLEDDKKRRLKALRDAITGINEEYEGLTKLVSSARVGAMVKARAWDNQIAEERRKEQERLDREAARERERLEKRANRESEKGNYEKAAILEQQAAEPQARTIAPAPPPPKGISKRETWKFSITDANAVPREYCKPDEVAIGGVVRSLKNKANIPGVRIWMEETDVIRGA